MLSRWLRLWFGFRDPVNRGTYFRHGAGLMAFKYAIDALLVWKIGQSPRHPPVGVQLETAAFDPAAGKSLA